jgi:hypothetical protein
MASPNWAMPSRPSAGGAGSRPRSCVSWSPELVPRASDSSSLTPFRSCRRRRRFSIVVGSCTSASSPTPTTASCGAGSFFSQDRLLTDAEHRDGQPVLVARFGRRARNTLTAMSATATDHTNIIARSDADTPNGRHVRERLSSTTSSDPRLKDSVRQGSETRSAHRTFRVRPCDRRSGRRRSALAAQ